MRLHGGAERIAAHKINHLVGHDGHEVYLLTTEQKGQSFVYALDEAVQHRDLGIDYHRGRSYFHPSNLGKLLKHLLKLNAYIGEVRPDVIVSVSFSPEQYFLPYLKRGVAKVKEFHSSGSVKVKGSRQDKLEGLFRGYDALVVLNPSEEQYYDNDNMVVIPNFTDFKPITQFSERKKVVIAAGRIAPVKQFDKLIAAWNLIAADFPDWKLKIYGDGNPSDVEKLQGQIVSLGLSGSASVNAAVPSLREEFLSASIYAMTSKTECFPMVLLEAQASGLPVVSFACPHGPENIIADGQTGFLTPLDNLEAFAEKLSALMTDETKRKEFAVSSVESVRKFTQAEVMRQWNELFQQVAKSS